MKPARKCPRNRRRIACALRHNIAERQPVTLSRPNTSLLPVIVALGAWCMGGSPASAEAPHNPSPQAANSACPHDDSGLKLPPGFCATVFADGVAHARHLVVAPNRVVSLTTSSRRSYGNTAPP